MEEWKVIEGYENYEVSSFGNVRNKKGLILKPGTDRGGYKLVRLSKDNKPTTCKVHRLVANTFIGYNMKPVDHIDRNPANNHIDNLRFVTFSLSNHNRSAKNEFAGVCVKKQTGKFVAQICKDGKRMHIGYFNSAEEAGRAYDKKAKELYGSNASLNFPE